MLLIASKYNFIIIAATEGTVRCQIQQRGASASSFATWPYIADTKGDIPSLAVDWGLCEGGSSVVAI